MSSRRFRQGLVVGKFAPLHQGHELLIETARVQCDRVLVLSYCKPEIAGHEPARRRAWLEAAFPDLRVVVVDEAGLHASGLALDMPANDAPGERHRQFVARVCHRMLDTVVDAVFTSEDYGQAFADALAEYYRSTLATPSLRVAHVAVDPERQRVPTSGTIIRRDAHAERRWLRPHVYASLIQRVALLGAESSGKTSLARALARAHGTSHVEEYGRERWLEREGRLDEGDLIAIAREQVRREEAALPDSRDYLFCDTSPLTTAVYSRLMFGHVPQELAALAQRSYDLLVYCTPDFPFVQDGTRRDADFRAKQDALTRGEIERLGGASLRVEGPIEGRMQRVLDWLRDRDAGALDVTAPPARHPHGAGAAHRDRRKPRRTR